MNGSFLFGVAALFTLLPAAFFRPARVVDGNTEGPSKDGFLFWLLLGVATLGPVALEMAAGRGVWRTGFSTTLWTIIASTMLVYFLVCLVSVSARKLQPLLLPYLILLALIALLWSSVPEQSTGGVGMTTWLQIHIAVSVVTYALITVAATAGFSVWLKERALRKRDTSLRIAALPAIAEGERLQLQLLILAELVLAAGLLSGAATQLAETGSLIAFDHKTVLSIAAFAVLGILLLLQRTSGLRGRRATQLVLITYLLITLAFPGVKFVTDVVLS